MAVPEIVAHTFGKWPTNTITSTITLPGNIQSGQLLLVLFVQGHGSTSFTWDDSTAGTWTTVFDYAQGGDHHSTLKARVADGTESGKSLTITINGSAGWYRNTTWYCLQLQNWEGTIAGGVNLPAAGPLFNNAANRYIDPRASDDSWGTVDRMTVNLGMGNYATDGISFGTGTVPPSGYTKASFAGEVVTDYVHADINGAGGYSSQRLTYHYKTGTEGSQDPGQCEIRRAYVSCATIAIQGGTAGANPPIDLEGTIPITSSASGDLFSGFLVSGDIAVTSGVSGALTVRAITSTTSVATNAGTTTGGPNTGVTTHGSNAGTTTAATNTGVTTDGS